MLEIYKASAGAGKTHRLTGEYLRMLFGGRNFDPSGYRRILAVTFTNKATAEMKQRILDELHRLSCDPSSSAFFTMLASLPRYASISGTMEKADALGRDARKMAVALLNDYNNFSISTIDGFFHKILKAFAREVGYFPAYTLELDVNKVLEYAVDELMDSLDGNPALVGQLIKISVESMEKGSSWDISARLIGLGKELFSEKFTSRCPESGLDREAIGNYSARIDGIIADYRRRAASLASSAVAIMRDCGLKPEDFKYGKRSPMSVFTSLAEGILAPPSASLIKFNEGGADTWYAASATPETKAAITNAYNAGLGKIVADTVGLLSSEDYHTAVEIRENMSVLAVLGDIQSEIKDYCRRANLLLISDTASLLSRIIDGSDTPFVYEKAGGRIDNYMIDEFQDTSALQWKNFLPLIREGLDNGNDSMIVGDVKQSIYRWRNSDWNILDSEVFDDFSAYNVKTSTLDCNYRSSRSIVSFNNGFFSDAVDRVGTARLGRMYSDIRQKLPAGDIPEGYVKVQFVPDSADTGWRDRVMEMLPGEVERLRSAGCRLSDMAVIVRTNAEGQAVAGTLVSSGYDIISEDSLSLGSSMTVSRIVNALRCIDNPDSIAGRLGALKPSPDSGKGSLYDACMDIIRENVEDGTVDTAFIQAFLDTVLEYASANGSDLHGFISWWDKTGKNRPIPLPEGNDAIRIITVHKAKGLGFGTVIVPFMEWPLSGGGKGGSDYLWCVPGRPPFDGLPIVPLRKRSSLERTVFADDYRREKEYSLIDAFNVAYVAFTRARRELVIFAPGTLSENGRYASVSDLLHAYLPLEQCPGGLWESGSPGPGGNAPAGIPDDNVVSCPCAFHRTGERLRIVRRSEGFFGTQALRDKGILMHSILSDIFVDKDIVPAVEKACRAGLVSEAGKAGLVALIGDMLEEAREMHWFDGSYTVRNEASVVTPSGKVYRPDRVMFSGKEAVVVDYKFGKHRHKAYAGQVRRYMSLMEQMGYGPVRGYVWYTGEIERV